MTAEGSSRPTKAFVEFMVRETMAELGMFASLDVGTDVFANSIRLPSGIGTHYKRPQGSLGTDSRPLWLAK